MHSIPRWLSWHRPITIWWPWRSAPRSYVPQVATGDILQGIAAHENVHVAQWLALGRLGFLWKYAHATGRLELEAEAFAAEAAWWNALVGTEHWGDALSTLDHFAAALYAEYGLGVSLEDCKARIAYYLTRSTNG